jgi:hypothetical protein
MPLGRSTQSGGCVSTGARTYTTDHKTHVVDTKVIQCLGNLNLLGSVEKSVGELLALTESGLNDLETRDIAQEIGDTAVWVVAAVWVWVDSGRNSGVPLMACPMTHISLEPLKLMRYEYWAEYIPLEEPLALLLVWPLVTCSGSQDGHMVAVVYM